MQLSLIFPSIMKHKELTKRDGSWALQYGKLQLGKSKREFQYTCCSKIKHLVNLSEGKMGSFQNINNLGVKSQPNFC